MRLFKRLFLFLLALSVVYISLFVSANFIFQEPLAGFLEKRLSSLINAKVNIKTLKTDLLTKVSLDHIQIKREDKSPLHLAISSVTFKYFPLSLFQSRFKGKIELKNLSFQGKALQKNILIIFSFKPQQFAKFLEIEEIILYLDGALTVETKGTIEGLFKPRILILSAQIPSLSYPGFGLKDLSLNLNLSKGLESFGNFSIKAFNYNRLSLNNINSKIFFLDKKMHFKNLEIDIFEGRLEGNLVMYFLPAVCYDLNLKMTGLNLKEITLAFAPQDFRARGVISGDLKLRIEGKDLKDLQGRIYSQKPGVINTKAIKRLLSGTQTVIDKKILKKDAFLYENLTGDISLLKDNIIVKLLLEAKEAELRFDINIEPEVLGSLLKQ